MRFRTLLPLFAVSALASGAPALADGPGLSRLLEQQIGQWADPRTAAETRTRCSASDNGNWPWGGRWRGCKGWKTESRVMETRALLTVRGPRDLPRPEKRLAETCARYAASAAAQVGQPEIANAVAAANATFASCASHSSLPAPERYEITAETRSAWGDWH